MKPSSGRSGTASDRLRRASPIARRLTAGAVLLGAAMLGLWLAPTLLAWSRLEARVAALLGERIGAPVQLRGLRGELLPRPLLLAEAVEIRLEPLVLVDGVRAELALWPLLRGRIVVVELELERWSGLPLQLPTALLGQGGTLRNRLDASRLQRVEVGELELWPGDVPWRARLEHGSAGWKARLDRGGQRFEVQWSPGESRLAMQVQSPPGSRLAGHDWPLPQQASWTLRWQDAELVVEQLQADWDAMRIHAQATVSRADTNLWRIEGEIDPLRFDRLELLAGLEASGALAGPFWTLVRVDAPGSRLEDLRFEARGALELRGAGVDALLGAAGGVGSELSLAALSALLDWNASGLRIRRIEASAPTGHWMGHLAMAPDGSLRGELAVFGQRALGQRLSLSGRREQPVWDRAGQSARPNRGPAAMQRSPARQRLRE